jgi:hypothetical protein
MFLWCVKRLLGTRHRIMAIETIGEALSLGWRVFVRCRRGRPEDAGPKSSRECGNRREPDLETLVWTRGHAFPLTRLESRLRCPQYGNRNISVLFDPPANRAVSGR